MTNKRHRAPLAIVPTSEESDFTQALLDLPEQWAPRRNAPVAKPRHLRLVSTGDGAGIAPEGPDPCVDGPLDAREKVRYRTGRSIAIMCPAFVTRRMSAGPDGVRDPLPSNDAASKAVVRNGFSGSSVRPIVISFSSFTLASTRGLDGRRLLPTTRPARHRDPCRLMPSGSSRCSIPAKAARRFDRLELGEI